MTCPLVQEPASLPEAAPAPFVKVQGARATLLDALFDESPSDDAQRTPTKRHRRASRLQRWVEDQHALADPVADLSCCDAALPLGTPPNAFLAYPHLSLLSLNRPGVEDADSLHSYVVVEDEDGNACTPVIDLDGSVENALGVPGSPTPSSPQLLPPSPDPGRPSLLALRRPGSALRISSLTLPLSSPAASSTSVPTTLSSVCPSTPPPKASASARFLPSSFTAGHRRGASTGSLVYSLTPPSVVRYGSTSPSSTSASLATPPRAPGGSTSSSPWRFSRPSVMGYFSSTSLAGSSADTHAGAGAGARPSMSSARTNSTSTSGTRTTTITTLSSASASSSSVCPRTPRKGGGSLLGPGSVRTRSNLFAPSLWSLPADGSHMFDAPGSTTMLAGKGAGSLRVPLPRRPQGQGADDSAGGGTSAFALSLPKVLAIPRTKKKRKLVISGIGMGDDARVEGVRKWCESFGEVSQMVRVPNGDLHVDFKKSEVADTVCRLHARVFIVGVGSVCLSWYKGKKP